MTGKRLKSSWKLPVRIFDSLANLASLRFKNSFDLLANLAPLRFKNGFDLLANLAPLRFKNGFDLLTNLAPLRFKNGFDLLAVRPAFAVPSVFGPHDAFQALF